MPKSKGSIVRMLGIDECLRSRFQKYWSVQDFIKFLREKRDITVSERTILGDIYLMRYCSQLNYNAPIRYVKKENGYCYTDPEYSISKLPLTGADLNALALAASTLNQYKQVAALSEFTAAIDKVISLVNHIQSKEKQSSFSFIEFEKAPYSKGYEHLNLLVEAIKSRKRVRLNYQKFNELEHKSRDISPYMLKEYRNRWYLLGY